MAQRVHFEEPCGCRMVEDDRGYDQITCTQHSMEIWQRLDALRLRRDMNAWFDHFVTHREPSSSGN